MFMEVVSLKNKNGFTKGKVYTVDSIDEIYYLVKNDKGNLKHTWSGNFTTLIEYREKKIEKLIGR